MTDVVTAARNARECLAQGLSALQSPGVPEHLMAAAEPIARAMSNLHRIEATGGQAIREAAPVALDAARNALSLLQAAPIMHPAVNAALEAVAGSLGVVHRLTQSTGSTRPASNVAMGSTAVLSPNAAGPYVAPQVHAQPAPAAPAPYVAQPAPAAPVAAAPLFAPMQPGAPVAAHPAQQPFGAVGFAPTMVGSNPLADTKQSVGVPPNGPDSAFAPSSTMQSQGNVAAAPVNVSAQPVYGTAPTQPEAGALSPSAARSPAGAVVVDAALGAHSPTNFYKGLSGNDVVDAGGIFVATYQIPPMGTNLALRVSLPGGYEFQAQAVVRWVREPSAAGDNSSPGFGAQFTTISQEGRQLVYRYVRNREPLFHDDF